MDGRLVEKMGDSTGELAESLAVSKVEKLGDYLVDLLDIYWADC